MNILMAALDAIGIIVWSIQAMNTPPEAGVWKVFCWLWMIFLAYCFIGNIN